jgi:hypothetical protein
METNAATRMYLKFPQINFQDVIYYSAPKSQKKIEER